jgi:biopolymer transport protein ExbB
MWYKLSVSLAVLLLPSLALAEEGEVPTASLPHDLSPWGMFMNADWVVKAVMIGLAIASVVTWTVWVVKVIEVWRLRKQLRQALKVCGKATGLEAATSQGLPSSCCVFLCQARDELALSQGLTSVAGVKERTESRLAELESSAQQTLTQGTGLLATIGSTAPFVGLFGTVWGIMNSFIGISHAHTTNLAVVAPGIAEALLATAMGLVAAIPAVVLYNYLARKIGSNRALLRQLSMQVMRLVSRDLDRGVSGEAATHGHEAA